MRRRSIAAGAVLLVSIGLNLALIQTVRSLYISAKVRAARPDNSGMYSDLNADLQSGSRTTPLVVLFGDSRIAEWSPEPRLRSSARLVNRGIDGETTEQMKLRFENDILALRPQVVVIQAGINDLVAASLVSGDLRDAIVDRCVGNLKDFARRAAEQGSGVLLLTIIPPARPPLYRWLVWDSAIWGIVDSVNERIGSASANGDVAILDASAALMSNGSWNRGVTKDTLHLTPTGYERLNDLLAVRIDDLLEHAVQ
jgi:lysophospholipase L1-like esterase